MSSLTGKKHVFTNDLNCQGALHTALIGPEADIEEGTYIEDTCLEGRTHVGKSAVVSGLSLKDVHIPANTVFHGVKLKDEITELYGGQTGRCVIRTYGVMDNPKKTLEERGSFLRGNLADFLSANGLAPEDIWTGRNPRTLECKTVSGLQNIPGSSTGRKPSCKNERRTC